MALEMVICVCITQLRIIGIVWYFSVVQMVFLKSRLSAIPVFDKGILHHLLTVFVIEVHCRLLLYGWILIALHLFNELCAVDIR